jgi:Fe-S-cluster-containing hydrogenase component 2
MSADGRRILHVNGVPCTGCLSCMSACPAHPPLFRVELDVFGGRHGHVWCRQCDDARCSAACPAGAIARDGGTGAWVLDGTLCTGCGACVEACPFSAVIANPAGPPSKCDLCGGSPRCAAACHFGAILFLQPGDPRRRSAGMPPEEQDPGLGRGIRP